MSGPTERLPRRNTQALEDKPTVISDDARANVEARTVEPPLPLPPPAAPPPPSPGPAIEALEKRQALNERLETLRREATEAGVEFSQLDGFIDEYDRKVAGQRNTVHEASQRQGLGVTPEEIIERELDRSDIRGPKRSKFMEAYRPKWVYRLGREGREGVRILEHEGNGFFIVKPSKWESWFRPVAGVTREDTWIQGDLILMAETLENYQKRIYRTRVKAYNLDAGYRAAVQEEMKRAARESPGGRVFAHRDIPTFADLVKQPDISGPNPHTL